MPKSTRTESGTLTAARAVRPETVRFSRATARAHSATVAATAATQTPATAFTRLQSATSMSHMPKQPSHTRPQARACLSTRVSCPRRRA